MKSIGWASLVQQNNTKQGHIYFGEILFQFSVPAYVCAESLSSVGFPGNRQDRRASGAQALLRGRSSGEACREQGQGAGEGQAKQR